MKTKAPPLGPSFDRRIKLETYGARLSSAGGPFAWRGWTTCSDSRIRLPVSMGMAEVTGTSGTNCPHSYANGSPVPCLPLVLDRGILARIPFQPKELGEDRVVRPDRRAGPT